MNREPKPTYSYRKAVIAGTLAATGLLSGCIQTGNSISAAPPAAAGYEITGGTIVPDSPGVNIRTDARVVESGVDGTDNACGFTEVNIPIGPGTVFEEQGDSNGPWTRIAIEQFPRDIQESCAYDADGDLFVAERFFYPQ